MDKHVLNFAFEKATKNTVRLQEVVADGKPPVVGTLYVQGWAVGSEQEIEVTISPVTKAKGK